MLRSVMCSEFTQSPSKQSLRCYYASDNLVVWTSNFRWGLRYHSFIAGTSNEVHPKFIFPGWTSCRQKRNLNRLLESYPLFHHLNLLKLEVLPLCPKTDVGNPGDITNPIQRRGKKCTRQLKHVQGGVRCPEGLLTCEDGLVILLTL